MKLKGRVRRVANPKVAAVPEKKSERAVVDGRRVRTRTVQIVEPEKELPPARRLPPLSKGSKKDLVSLEDWNRKHRAAAESLQRHVGPRLNGIACPTCGEQLQDVGNVVLVSFPPQLDVQCVRCGFRGTRVA